MITQKTQKKRLLSSKQLCLLLPLTLVLMGLPQATYAQGPRPPIVTPNSSQPCADNDQTEICRLRRAVSAAQDQIADLETKLKSAKEAIASLQVTADAAQAAIKTFGNEREAYKQTLTIAQTAIQQQQDLIGTLQGAIKSLQDLIANTLLPRIHKLEDKIDKANTRAAILSIIVAVATVAASIKR